ncbi:receptor like protein 9 [Hibiscus trionum]|uniref:Receptor like protein 9 n=1 Tax=Hibiscus trionum TaxID=183268 RepID=A0A9W7LX69_HIBTR|nr:receptor like protein 9 [Hibiscus trionum]
MESKWLELVMLLHVLGVLMLGTAELCEGCSEEERVALSRLKPFFPFIDYTTGHPGLNYYSTEEDYDSVEEKESSLDCCKWSRVECNPNTGRVIKLFLHDRNGFFRDPWFLNASLFLPFQELQCLSLSGNLIAGCLANQGFEKLSSKLDKLETLDLSYNYFNDSILTSISQLSSLKFLDFTANFPLTKSNTTNGIKMLSKLNNLETLNLSNNPISNILSQLHDFTSLKSLNLRNCRLKGIVDLTEFNTLMNLKELYLDFNAIESLGSSFQGKGQLKLNKLEVLGLSGNHFTNSIFSSLAALPNLKSLNLGFNKLKGPIDMKDLNSLINLEELILWSNGVTELVHSQELRLMNLSVLDLIDNPLDSSKLSSLGKLPNLKILSFGSTELKRSINITEIVGLSNLEQLDVYCHSDTDCSFSLQSLGLFPSLKTLYLIGFTFDETTSYYQNSK